MINWKFSVVLKVLDQSYVMIIPELPPKIATSNWDWNRLSGSFWRLQFSARSSFNAQKGGSGGKKVNPIILIKIFLCNYIGRVSSDDKNRVCSCETRFQHEHRFMNLNRPTREWAEWVSEPVNGASERSERSEAERCGASEWSERCERTNERSERPSGPFKTRLSHE